jgi:hypothetical protein
VPERARHRSRAIGEHGYVHQHRLHQRDPEAFVLAHGHEDVRCLVAGEQVAVLEVAGEDHLPRRQAQLDRQRLESVEIAAATRRLAHQHQAQVGRDVALPVSGHADEVVMALVGDETADEKDVGAPVREVARQHVARRFRIAREVEVDGQDARAREARRLQLLAVELAVAEGEVHMIAKSAELLAPDPADADHLLVVALEEPGGRDVVMDEGAPSAMPLQRLGQGRRERVVQDDRVRGRARAPLRPGAPVTPQILVQLESVDVRLVAPRAEGVPHQPRGVADGIAAMERGHPLVDPHDASTGRRRSS